MTWVNHFVITNTIAIWVGHQRNNMMFFLHDFKTKPCKGYLLANVYMRITYTSEVYMGLGSRVHSDQQSFEGFFLNILREEELTAMEVFRF